MFIDNLISKEIINKGWSGDKKYRVSSSDESIYLLRISPLEKHDRRKREFDRMCEVAKLGIPMATPIEFGICDEGVYTIEGYIEGFDAEEYLPTLSSDTQYSYGLDAGRFLAKIHTIPAPDDIPDWEDRFNAKIDRKIATYQACDLKYERDHLFLKYIEDNRHLLANRPQTYQHGDYHIGNMMIEDGKIVIIDFDRYDFGDPWEEFNRIVWCAQAAPAFASGNVDGYFGGEVPHEFWTLLALYIGSNMLSSIPWAIPFGDQEINTMMHQAREVLDWYDNFNNVVPKWYKGVKNG